MLPASEGWTPFLLRILEQQGVAVLVVLLVGLILYERGLRPLRDAQVELRAKTQALVEVVTRVLQRLVQRRLMKGDELLELLRPLLAESVGQVVRLEEQRLNPLTPQELERLKYYQRKLQANEPFSAEEARDLQALTEKVAAERPGEPAVWILAFFVGLLSGVLLASPKQS